MPSAQDFELAAHRHLQIISQMPLLRTLFITTIFLAVVLGMIAVLDRAWIPAAVNAAKTSPNLVAAPISRSAQLTTSTQWDENYAEPTIDKMELVGSGITAI